MRGLGDVLEGRTHDDGDVDVGSLLDSLGVGAGVGDDDQAGLLEGAGDVVGEVTGGEATGNGDGTGVVGELQDGTLTVGTGRDDANWGVELARCRVVGVCIPPGARLQQKKSSAGAGRAEEAQAHVLSAGLSMVAMMRAARTIFSQVLPTFRTLTPSARVFHR
jgi:hypothetical protein